MTDGLPVPTRSRWQPLRAGLVDLFYYDVEEFWFRDGRLLLRGNNGTGKSKVLALTLPFLLDADLAAHRVEPDADPKKRMEWNLLLGGDHPHSERLGYTWLEFGRVDESGTCHYRTLGCGLKAVSGKGIARHWFFSTTLRVGDGLQLVDATRTALLRDRLVDALGEHGQVYDRRESYRRAVDEALFGLGPQRYDALVDLLVHLRQPHLAKRPSEQALSNALTEALPPLDQAVIADVAEAFHSLEEDKSALETMVEARDSATTFLADYRRYARIAIKRRTDRPRRAQAAYEQTNRRLAEAQKQHAAARELLAEVEKRLTNLAAERRRLDARREALRESPEMHDAGRLERAAEDARRLRATATDVAGQRDAAGARVDRLREREQDADGELGRAASGLAGVRRRAEVAATRARLADEHADLDRQLDDTDHADRAELDRLAHRAEESADRQARALTELTRLLTALEQAEAAVAVARKALDDLDTDVAELAGRRTAADELVTTEGAELVAAVRRHLSQTVELRVADPAAAVAALELWVETLAGPNPVTAAVAAAVRTATRTLAELDAELAGQERAASERRSELSAEIERLERGEHDAPPVPYTRDADARRDRPGAPLWQLVDFVDGVPEADRAGLEAALEAAGVLDAWVTPAGELLDATADVVVRPGPASADSLRNVLEPAVDRADPAADAVSDETLDALLRSIGTVAAAAPADGTTAVGRDGRFHLGVLAGAWRKPAAAYIGRGAREAARRRRLADLRAELDRVEAELAELAGQRQVVSGRRRTLDAEADDVPKDERLAAAHADVRALIAESQRLAERRARAEERLRESRTAAESARSTAETTAHDLHLPPDRAELAAVGAGLGDYRVSLAELWSAARAHLKAAGDLAQIRSDVAEATTTLAGLEQRLGTAQRDADGAEERHQTLQKSVGAAVEELHRQLSEVSEQLRGNAAAEDSARSDQGAGQHALGEAEGQLTTRTEELAKDTAERVEAADAFRRFATTGLITVALPDFAVPDPTTAWAPDPTVRLARQADAKLPDVPVDDQSWERAQNAVNTGLKTLDDTLQRHGNKVSADLREDGVVVEIEFQGKATGVPELVHSLEAEVNERRRLLDEREREVLENHLIDEVASTLQELISAADAQVASMNDELDSRPTSTGMRLRLRWLPREDGPTGLAEARKRLLLQTSDAWSAEDRSAVGDFLHGRIKQVRERQDGGTWLEHLTEALDYRAWHRFVIQRYQNGQWRPAAGPASGGERALVVSVPLFAAASAHYASAAYPHAPRLVTLDEAFAGVDDNARAKYLGLLAVFDLDVVMTSEREWGCYPEVPGLAISHLARSDGVPAVLVSNWEWDGSRRTRVERELHAVPARVDDEPRADGLWE